MDDQVQILGESFDSVNLVSCLQQNREQLLHQPLLVGFQGVEFFGLSDNKSRATSVD